MTLVPSALDPNDKDETGIPPFTIAFQPIVDIGAGRIYSYEALVRGERGESAQALFLAMDPQVLPAADAAFRHKAICLAGDQGLRTMLNLNVIPSTLERSAESLMATIDQAGLCGINADQLMLEITEREIIVDLDAFAETIDDLRQAGLRFAIDDFGAGFAGLNLLADFQPDVVKLDFQLVGGIASRGPRQAIVRGITRTCTDLGIEVIAGGIDCEEDYFWFVDEGITLFQGHILASPSLETLSPTFAQPQRS